MFKVSCLVAVLCLISCLSYGGELQPVQAPVQKESAPVQKGSVQAPVQKGDELARGRVRIRGRVFTGRIRRSC